MGLEVNFPCKKCHATLNADFNGSRNIALRGKMLVAIGHKHGLPPTSLHAPRCSGSLTEYKPKQ